MLEAEKDTVAMPFVRAAVAKLDGAERRRVLAEAGIPGELLARDTARVPARAFAALWLSVAQTLDDEFFGLDRRRMKVGSFALLSQALIGCERLDQALRRLLRGFAVVLDDLRGELALDQGDAVLSLHDAIAAPEDRRFAHETFLVLVHGLMCWLVGRRVPVTLASFAYPRPAHGDEYRVMYAPRLAFDAPQTALRFDARQLALPVVQTGESLRAFLRSAPQAVFLKYKNEDGWAARVRRRLREQLGPDGWPRLEDLAAEYGVAPATLRRRLEAEGTSYQALKDALRRDAAIDQLCHGSLSIAEIGHALGFQEPSAFHRAFKKWSGVQPGEYRMQQRQLQGPQPRAAPQD